MIPEQWYGNVAAALGSRAFRYCSALTGVTIPDSVTNIGDILEGSSLFRKIIVGHNSSAEKYCKNHHLRTFMLPDTEGKGILVPNRIHRQRNNGIDNIFV